MTATIAASIHLVLQTGLLCSCKEDAASRWRRCRKCKAIVTGCGSCGTDIAERTEEHCS